MKYVIESKNLTRHFSRNRVKALQNLSLSVEPGKIFGLLGPNGAGKTTFVKILLGILHPTSGSAFLFETSVNNSTARARVGYLPENHRFPEFLTGGAFLDYCGRLSGIKSKDKRKTASEQLLRQVKLTEWESTRTKKYSKGMLQRLGIAQALLHDPDLIFLDEPTDGVDPIGRKEIRDLLLELKQKGKTIFINSHLLSEVEMICDEVAILNKVVLITHGSVAELTTSNKRYQIEVNSDASFLSSQIKKKTSFVNFSNSSIEIEVTSPEQLNGIIDLLRKNSLLISEISPRRQTLEDSFFQAIKNSELSDLNEIFRSDPAFDAGGRS